MHVNTNGLKEFNNGPEVLALKSNSSDLTMNQTLLNKMDAVLDLGNVVLMPSPGSVNRGSRGAVHIAGKRSNMTISIFHGGEGNAAPKLSRGGLACDCN